MTGIEILYILGSMASIYSAVQQRVALTADGKAIFSGDISSVISQGDADGTKISRASENLTFIQRFEDDPFIQVCADRIKEIREKMADAAKKFPVKIIEIAEEGANEVCKVLKAIKKSEGKLTPDLQELWERSRCIEL